MTGSEITVTFLGTGSAVPVPDRQQSSIALRHNNGLVIFDCGEGTQYALRRLKISTRKELVIWISHLHSDHFLGVPGLLASFQLLARDQPVIIVGPAGIELTVKNLMIANYVQTSYEVRVVELQPGDVFNSDGYQLETIKADHEANALSVMWRENSFPGRVNMRKLKELGVKPGPLISQLQEGKSVEYDGKTIHPDEVIGPVRRGRAVFYSGDTAYNEKLTEFVTDCDILIHEASYPSEMVQLAQERKHTTVSEAALIAAKCQPERTILTHISPRIQDFEHELAIARKQFKDIEFAVDGMTVDIEYPYHE